MELTLNPDQLLAARQARINEVGTEPDCPFCHQPRVSRTTYIRCNPCGINWLAEEMHLPNYLRLDPRVARQRAALTGDSTRPTAGPSVAAADGARAGQARR